MITFNNKVITINNDWLKYDTTPVDPYNPLGLPPYTIRVKYIDGHTPTFSKGTGVQVSSSPNVWDLTYENSDWSNLLQEQYNEYYLLEVLGANTSNVTNMSRMFNYCEMIKTLPLFDTSSVTEMIYMFYQCRALQTIPLFNTINVRNMSSMFSNCSALTNVPLLDTRNVTNISFMFSYCSSLTSVPLFDTKKVTSMKAMFQRCSSLSSVPLFDTSNITNISSMLRGCTSLTTIPLFNTSKVDWITDMCNECTNVKSGALALYQQASTQANPPTNHYATFRNCGSNTTTGSAELSQIPSDWK